MHIETHQSSKPNYNFVATLHCRANGVLIEITAYGETRPKAKTAVKGKIKELITQLKEL